LLVLIDGLDADSKYKVAVDCGGDLSERDQWAMQTFNEIARLHHTLQAVNAGEQWEDYDPPRFLSRLERIDYWRALEQEDAELAEAIAEAEDDMFS
jgi:hypothetical protein